MNEKFKNELSKEYKRGYRIGFLTAVHFLRGIDKELSEKLINYYNQYPLIEPIQVNDDKNS